MRICEQCGADTSGRVRKTRYCLGCAKTRLRQAESARRAADPNRGRYYRENKERLLLECKRRYLARRDEINAKRRVPPRAKHPRIKLCKRCGLDPIGRRQGTLCIACKTNIGTCKAARDHRELMLRVARTLGRVLRLLRTSKMCVGCKKDLPVAAFYSRGGTCKSCHSQSLMAVRVAVAADPEARKASAEYQRAWWRANPDKIRDREARRRARKNGAKVVDLTDAQWLEILETHDRRCAYCLRRSEQLEKDHVVALMRGGDHTAENIVPACRSCNAKKHALPIFMMARCA